MEKEQTKEQALCMLVWQMSQGAIKNINAPAPRSKISDVECECFLVDFGSLINIRAELMEIYNDGNALLEVVKDRPYDDPVLNEMFGEDPAMRNVTERLVKVAIRQAAFNILMGITKLKTEQCQQRIRSASAALSDLVLTQNERYSLEQEIAYYTGTVSNIHKLTVSLVPDNLDHLLDKECMGWHQLFFGVDQMIDATNRIEEMVKSN